MTLTEYLNQQDPARMPVVVLSVDEYTTFTAYGPDQEYGVYIEGIEFPYVKVKGSNRLMTVDGDGNTKGHSCFWIND